MACESAEGCCRGRFYTTNQAQYDSFLLFKRNFFLPLRYGDLFFSSSLCNTNETKMADLLIILKVK